MRWTVRRVSPSGRASEHVSPGASLRARQAALLNRRKRKEEEPQPAGRQQHHQPRGQSVLVEPRASKDALRLAESASGRSERSCQQGGRKGRQATPEHGACGVLIHLWCVCLLIQTECQKPRCM